MTKFHYTTLVVLIIGAGFIPQSAKSQNVSEAIIEGSVVDGSANGKVLANASVEILELDKKTQTDENGEFSFQNLNPDRRDLEVTFHVKHEGYEEQSETIYLVQTRYVKFELTPQSETKNFKNYKISY